MFYGLNDDVTIRNILSGIYSGSPNGHGHPSCIKYPLTGFLSLLYRIAGNIPWYSLCMMFFLLLGAGVVLVGIWRGTKTRAKVTRKIAMFVGAAFVTMFIVPQAIMVHYTVVAAVLAAGAMFWFAMEETVMLPAGMLMLCYCVRSQVFFLALPFLFVLLVWKVISKRPKICVRLVMITLCAVGLSAGWNTLMYGSEQWREYVSYNEVRTNLYDYLGLLPYDGYEDVYQEIGLSKEQQQLLEQYALTLDASIDTQRLEGLENAMKNINGGKRWQKDYVKWALTEYYYHFTRTDMPYNLILITLYGMLIALLIADKEPMRLLLMIALAGGRSLIWIYLIWCGRFPDRVMQALYTLEILLLAGLFLQHIFEREGRKRKGVLVLLGAVVLLGGVFLTHNACVQALDQREKQKEWDVLQAYCEEHADNLYLLDVYSVVQYTDCFWETDTTHANYTMDGGWLSGSPLLQEKYAAVGASDGADALINCENVCYIARNDRDLAWLEEYLSLRDETCELSCVDEVDGGRDIRFRVYRCVTEKN